MRTFLPVALLVLLLLSGCAHVMSQEARQKADPSLTFEKLRQFPDAAVGKYAILGGEIASVTNGKGENTLEVVQFPLGRDEYPDTDRRSYGRFLAVTKEFLDPVVYKQGKMVTIFGQVQGKRSQKIGETDYVYPVISILELYLWPPEPMVVTSPLGPLPGPYYDPWWYYGNPDPFWYSPYIYRSNPPFRRW